MRIATHTYQLIFSAGDEFRLLSCIDSKFEITDAEASALNLSFETGPRGGFSLHPCGRGLRSVQHLPPMPHTLGDLDRNLRK